MRSGICVLILLGLAEPLSAQSPTTTPLARTVDLSGLRLGMTAPGAGEAGGALGEGSADVDRTSTRSRRQFVRHFHSNDSGAGETPVQSFAGLQRLLTPGERLVVRDKAGKTTKGRLVSLTAGELQIRRRRWNFRTERKTWKEASVRRIQHEDSGWNGSLIGAGVGVAAIVTALKLPVCNRPDDLRCLPVAATGVQVGALVGNAVDKSVNRTVYESPTP